MELITVHFFDSSSIVVVYLFLKKILLVSVHLVIATPGRVLDLMNKGVLVAKNCRMLILDEVSRVALTSCGVSRINAIALFCECSRHIL